MDNRGWRKLLLDLYSTLAIEGQLGPIVTLNAPQGLQIAEIAQIPQVLTIRLPRDGSPAIGGKNTLPPPKEEP